MNVWKGDNKLCHHLQNRKEQRKLGEIVEKVTQMTDEQLKEAGVPAELIRISLGLEDKEDLIADISNALDAIRD